MLGFLNLHGFHGFLWGSKGRTCRNITKLQAQIVSLDEFAMPSEDGISQQK